MVSETPVSAARGVLTPCKLNVGLQHQPRIVWSDVVKIENREAW